MYSVWGGLLSIQWFPDLFICVNGFLRNRGQFLTMCTHISSHRKTQNLLYLKRLAFGFTVYFLATGFFLPMCWSLSQYFLLTFYPTTNPDYWNDSDIPYDPRELNKGPGLNLLPSYFLARIYKNGDRRPNVKHGVLLSYQRTNHNHSFDVPFSSLLN